MFHGPLLWCTKAGIGPGAAGAGPGAHPPSFVCPPKCIPLFLLNQTISICENQKNCLSNAKTVEAFTESISLPDSHTKP